MAVLASRNRLLTYPTLRVYGSKTLWYGSGSSDLYQWLFIRIFYLLYFFSGYQMAEIIVFLNFLLSLGTFTLVAKDPGSQKSYGSRSKTLTDFYYLKALMWIRTRSYLEFLGLLRSGFGKVVQDPVRIRPF